jgi:hypothetical protein
MLSKLLAIYLISLIIINIELVGAYKTQTLTRKFFVPVMGFSREHIELALNSTEHSCGDGVYQSDGWRGLFYKASDGKYRSVSIDEEASRLVVLKFKRIKT